MPDTTTPKVESTGIVQDKGKPVAASSVNPNAPTKKEDADTPAAKASPNPALKPNTSNTQNTDVQKAQADREKKENARALDKHVTKLESNQDPTSGDVTVTVTRDDMTFNVPLSLETDKDRYSVANAFKIIQEIMAVGTVGEAKDKFAGLIQHK